jgi:O-antigen ligase
MMASAIGYDDTIVHGKPASGVLPRSLAFWAAAFYVALFIIRPWEKLFPSLAPLHFERIYALVMIGIVMMTRGFRIRGDSQTIAVMLFFLAVGMSWAGAWNPDLGGLGFYVYFTLVVFYFVLVSVIANPYELVFMVACYIVTMAAYLAKAQWEYFVNGAGLYDQGVYRLAGIESTFGHPNSVAMSVAASLPMLWFLWRVRNEFTREWPHAWQRSFRLGLVAYAVLAATSILLTRSRSGMLCGILFVLLAALQGAGWLRKLYYLLMGGALLIVIWFLMPEKMQNRFRTIWDPEAGPANAQASAEGRPAGFRAGIEMFRRFPITGVGIGNFVEYRTGFVDGVPLQSHNLFGQVLGEMGLLGALSFLLLIGVTVGNSLRIRRAARGSTSDTLHVLSKFAVASRNAVLILLFDGLFGHNLYRFNWLWLAAFNLLALQYAVAAIAMGSQYLAAAGDAVVLDDGSGSRELPATDWQWQTPP